MKKQNRISIFNSISKKRSLQSCPTITTTVGRRVATVHQAGRPQEAGLVTGLIGRLGLSPVRTARFSGVLKFLTRFSLVASQHQVLRLRSSPAWPRSDRGWTYSTLISATALPGRNRHCSLPVQKTKDTIHNPKKEGMENEALFAKFISLTISQSVIDFTQRFRNPKFRPESRKT